MTIKKTLTAIAVASIAATAAVPAFAADDVTFEFSKQDLSSTTKVAKLYERINARSSQLCSDFRSRTVASIQRAKQCEADLVNDFVSGINDSRLAAMHAGEVSGTRYADNDR